MPVVFVAYPYRISEAEYRGALNEVGKPYDVEWKYADERITNKHILAKIEAMMDEAEFSLFDITYWNANVTLELGLAKGKGLPHFILWNPSVEQNQPPADLGGIDRIQYRDYTELKTGVGRLLEQEFRSLAGYEPQVARTNVAPSLESETTSSALTQDQSYWRDQTLSLGNPLIHRVSEYAPFEIDQEVRSEVSHYVRTHRGPIEGKFSGLGARLPSRPEEDRILDEGTRDELLALVRSYLDVFAPSQPVGFVSHAHDVVNACIERGVALRNAITPQSDSMQVNWVGGHAEEWARETWELLGRDVPKLRGLFHMQSHAGFEAEQIIGYLDQRLTELRSVLARLA